MKIAFLLVLILAYFMFIFHLGNMALLDDDEPLYAEAAREMIASHNWLIPHFNGTERLNKPVVFYWMIASAYKVLGVNEFSSRLWSAALGVIGVLLIYLFGKRIFNPGIGLISSAVLVTSLFYVVMARAATPDMALAFFITLSLISFFLSYTHKAGQRTCFFVFYLSLSLGVLTKGPVAIIIPLLVISLFLLLTGNFKKIFKRNLLWGSLIFLVVVPPWYIYAYDYAAHYLSSHDLMHFTFNETLGRFFLGYAHSEPVYFYIPVMFGVFFPWSCFLLFSVKDIFSKGWRALITDNQDALFVLIWFGTVFFFFSLCGCKLVNYILPLAPPFALLTGILWGKYLAGSMDKHLLKNMKYAFITLLVASAGLAISGIIAVTVKFRNFLVPGVLTSIICMGFIAISYKLFFAQKRWMAFFLLLISTGIIFIIQLHYVTPEIENLCSTKQLFTGLNPFQEKNDLISYHRLYPSSVFYSKKHVPVIRGKEKLLHLLNSGTKQLCIISKKRFSELKGKLPNSVIVLKQTGKILLVTNRPEELHANRL